MTELHYKGVPKRVRVGCYWFKVEVGESDDHEAESSFGHMNPISQKIRLRPGMTPQNLANTFIHEVLHAIYFYIGVSEMAEDQEEEFVTKGANGLCTFTQDNPAAMHWWETLLNMKEAK